MSVRDLSSTRRCECGYPVPNFTFGVLHRMWAHRDGPSEARAWAEKMVSSNVTPLRPEHGTH